MKPFLLLVLSLLSALAQSTNTNYRLAPDFPKYVTAHIEVRDPSGTRWPSFFYGKPATNGFIRIDPAHPTASFTLNCDKRPQKNGDQSRRVLGGLFDTPDKSGLSLQITGLGPVKTVADGKSTVMETTFTGLLDVAGKKVPFNASGTLRQHPAGRGDEKNEAVFADFQFDLKAADLGLKTFAADALLHLRASVTAYAPNAGARRTPKN